MKITSFQVLWVSRSEHGNSNFISLFTFDSIVGTSFINCFVKNRRIVVIISLNCQEKNNYL